MDELIRKIDMLARDVLKHPAWGYDHAKRVESIALQIAESEGFSIDKDLLRIAALLHDFGAYEPYKKEGNEHSVCSAEFAGNYLRAHKFDKEKIKLVKSIIMGHMFYARPEPPSQEAIALHDADVLDLLGEEGILRVNSTIGLKDGAKDAGEANRLLVAFREELPKTLLTESARRIALDKVGEMDEFFRMHGIK